MSVIPCRNRLEADFESLVATYINPGIKIDINDNNKNAECVDNTVTIETIVDFYVLNEAVIDLEGMVRAFITSVYFAKNEESAALSRWFLEVRSDIMKAISSQLMVIILTRKLELMLQDTTNSFMSEYIKWLVTSYCEENEKQNNRVVLITFVNRINRKLKNNKIILKSPIDKSFPTMIINAERDRAKVADFVLSTYQYLSDLYDQNN